LTDIKTIMDKLSKAEVARKIKYCITCIKNLSHDDLITVGRMISLRGFHDKIKESSDGCRINLDLIGESDESLIFELYNFIHNRQKE